MFKREDSRLGTDLKVYTGGGGFCVVDGLGTSFDVRAYAMVVAGSESRPIAQAVECDGVVGSTEADGARVTGEATLCDIV